MLKTNKCILVVADNAQRSGHLRYVCEAIHKNCWHFEAGESSFSRSEKGDGLPNCGCAYMGAVRADGTIPCKSKMAQRALLRIAMYAWHSEDPKSSIFGRR